MVQDHGVRDARHRTGRAGTLLQRLGIVFVSQDVGEATKQIANRNRCPVEVKKPFKKNARLP